MVKNRHYVSLFIVLFLMVAGCAGKKKEIPTEEIRARADRAFDDLRAEESGGSKALPQENKGSELKPPVQPVKKNSDNVQVKKGARPDWVDGNSSQYPSSGYLTGVGYDSERELAENKARTEIAKIFLSRIESKTKSYQSYLQVSSKGKLDIEENLSIQDITEVSTQMVLSGVRIVQVYQETKPESLFYALAVLDREQSMNILTDKIRELDMDIKDFLLRAEAEKDMLARVKYLKQAVRKHVMREAYDAELRIVNGIGTGISPPISFTEIKSRLESVLFRDFLIGVSVIGSRADEVQDALIQGLNQQGFSVS
ncbi:MAG TPA: LPP20 family lipoprotein, partial [Desulfatiglandales bacterium]|nr:LPP20 family lipoprotein [Desulfatiglandales bacterium]